MGQVVYRGNLSAAYFPFISRFQGRTIIVRGPDNNFSRQLESPEDTDKDIGIPQMYYCHNVMPTGNGFQSVGFEQRISSYSGGSAPGITQQFLLRDDSLQLKGYFALGIGGFYYVLTESLGYAGSALVYYNAGVSTPMPADILTRQVTTAHVAGVTYLYIANLGCMQWNFALGRFDLVTLTGLDPTTIVGITSSNGYLIAYSKNAVAWSSLISATDFTPSLITGAGGGNVEGIKGNITCGAPTSNGFLLYTEQNAIAVLYTGNSQYPFQFQEALGAGGVETLERVSYDAESGYNYAYTSNGMQVMQAKTATNVFPDLTDFLAGQWFEDFDDTTLQFSYQTLLVPLVKKLTYIANRYLVVSYGITELTHALIYDTVQKRWGKIKFTHVDCFEYNLLSENVSDLPRKSIAFIQKDGSVYVVNFALPITSRNGTIILGKYQYVRVRHMQLQEASIEGPTIGATFKIYALVSADGKNYSQTIPGTGITVDPDLGDYGFGAPAGINHSLLMQGAFNLTSIQLSFNIHGRM